MTPPRRKKDKHLPQNVYLKNNAYYFVSIIECKRKWMRLGKTLQEALIAYSKIISSPHNRIRSMNQLFDRYMLEVAPLKKEKSYKANRLGIVNLRIFFGEMLPQDVSPPTIYDYLKLRGQTAKVGANREKSLLSHCFTKAIEWGIVKDNPCKDVKRLTERPRTRYPEDEEFQAVYSIATPLIRCAMDLAYEIGQRKGDILKIKLTDFIDKGLLVIQNKTDVYLLISWSDELRRIYKNIMALPRHIRGMTLFCNRFGKQYTDDGFNTLWQRVMNKAVEKGIIKERFTFHDIRAKCFSDGGTSDLLGHGGLKISERVYRRTPKLVYPRSITVKNRNNRSIDNYQAENDVVDKKAVL